MSRLSGERNGGTGFFLEVSGFKNRDYFRVCVWRARVLHGSQWPVSPPDGSSILLMSCLPCSEGREDDLCVTKELTMVASWSNLPVQWCYEVCFFFGFVAVPVFFVDFCGFWMGALGILVEAKNFPRLPILNLPSPGLPMQATQVPECPLAACIVLSEPEGN